jgi:hypothetical protein
METDEFAVTRNGAEELDVLGEGMTLDEVRPEEDVEGEDDEVERLKDVASRLEIGEVSPALIGLVAVVFLDTVAVGKLKEILLAPTAVVDAVPRADDVDVSNDIPADIVVDDELLLGPEVDIPRSVELKDRSEAKAAKGDAAVVEAVRNEEVELSIVELSLVFGRTTGIISIVVGNDAMLLVVFWNGAACLNELIS